MIKVLEAIIFRRLLFWSISLKNNVNIVCGWWLGWFAGNQDDESWCNDSIVAGVKRSPCQVYQTDLNMRCSHHQYFDDKLNTSLLQTMTSTTEDMMETLDGTEMKFNDTDQRVNRKILNIFRATKDPNFLMKSFQSNGSFQQVLPSEGNRIFNFIFLKNPFLSLEADRFPIFPVLCSVLISYVFVILLGNISTSLLACTDQH